MIAVIADDFTGAAEIGGVALRHGLKVVIETDVNGVRDVDVVIVATNTRSMHPEEAAVEVRSIVKSLQRLNPRFIFKKLDSVLRGNVMAELEAQMDEEGLDRCLVVAGNPDFKRLIKDGRYYIDDVPLEETLFSNDPDFPLMSSSVLDLVGTGKRGKFNLSCMQEFPEEGIVFGDVENKDDMRVWAGRIDKGLLPAGGSGFFNAVLSHGRAWPTSEVKRFEQSGDRALFVFGSAYPKSSSTTQRLNASGISIVYMPDELYWNRDAEGAAFDKWLGRVLDALTEGKRVAVATASTSNKEVGLSLRIQKLYAALVAEVMQHLPLSDLLIEGGATTSEILSRLNIRKLYPYREIDTGVIQMNTDTYPFLCLTTKPGSYLWPEHFF